MARRRHPLSNVAHLSHHGRRFDGEQARTGLCPVSSCFPSIKYTARSVRNDTPIWSPGRYQQSVGHKIKYGKEFLDVGQRRRLRDAGSWQNPAWRAAHERRRALRCAQRVAGPQALPGPLAAPGRVGRFGRRYRRTGQRLTGWPDRWVT